MSTNKSANLNLHLWEPGDDFLRTEFNENFQKVDELANVLLTPAGDPSVCGYVSLKPGTPAGSSVITLDFDARFMLIEFYNCVYLMTPGKSRSITFASSNYSVTFQLNKNVLTLSKTDERITTSHLLYYVAFP